VHLLRAIGPPATARARFGGSCFALHCKAVTFGAVTTTAVALIATLQGFLLLVVGEVRVGRYGHLVSVKGRALFRPVAPDRHGRGFVGSFLST
jgi:hypothetical protein